jgi:hypothetical protein
MIPTSSSKGVKGIIPLEVVMRPEVQIARRLIALVRRRAPGVRAQMAWIDFDRALGVAFRLGQRRHGVRIRRGARKMQGDAAVACRIYWVLKRSKPRRSLIFSKAHLKAKPIAGTETMLKEPGQ